MKIKKKKIKGIRCFYFSSNKEPFDEIIKKYPPITFMRKAGQDFIGYCNFSDISNLINVCIALQKDEWRTYCATEHEVYEVGILKYGDLRINNQNDSFASLENNNGRYTVTQLKTKKILYSGKYPAEALDAWSKASRKDEDLDYESYNKALKEACDEQNKNSNCKISIQAVQGSKEETMKWIKEVLNDSHPKSKTELEILSEMPVVDIQKNLKVCDWKFKENTNFEIYNSRKIVKD